MSKRINGFTPFIVRLNEFYNDKIQTNEIKNTFLILLWDRSLFVALGKGEELPGEGVRSRRRLVLSREN